MDGSGKTGEVKIMRSELGRARGLGSARHGSGTWRAERLTSIALVPLSLWFIASVISLEGATRADMVAWLHAPVPLVLVLCLAVATFWHMELGLRVVIEDYVHKPLGKGALLFINFFLCLVLAVAAAFAVLKVAFGGGLGL
jgi:succinate dehydrogenase / fumarate reductase membrane anchor subunit